jgi:large subunit ribosomal protein L3
MKTIEGKKLNMSQIFQDDGTVIPVTLIKAEEGLDSDLEGSIVTVVGYSKGKGFTGVMKKWHFHGGDATRGQSNKQRSAGSIGSQTPGRVWKGKKMAGRLGNEKTTIKGLKIVRVSGKDSIFMVSGSVPGARNSKLTVEVMEKSNES